MQKLDIKQRHILGEIAWAGIRLRRKCNAGKIYLSRVDSSGGHTGDDGRKRMGRREMISFPTVACRAARCCTNFGYVRVKMREQQLPSQYPHMPR